MILIEIIACVMIISATILHIQDSADVLIRNNYDYDKIVLNLRENNELSTKLKLYNNIFTTYDFGISDFEYTYIATSIFEFLAESKLDIEILILNECCESEVFITNIVKHMSKTKDIYVFATSLDASDRIYKFLVKHQMSIGRVWVKDVNFQIVSYKCTSLCDTESFQKQPILS